MAMSEPGAKWASDPDASRFAAIDRCAERFEHGMLQDDQTIIEAMLMEAAQVLKGETTTTPN